MKFNIDEFSRERLSERLRVLEETYSSVHSEGDPAKKMELLWKFGHDTWSLLDYHRKHS